MNIQQLRYAVEIAATGSITKAAKNLFMGQPNLSKNIKELESEIGITLFARTPKGVVPTKKGEAFLGYARSIIAQMDTLSALYRQAEPAARALRIAAPRASYVAEAFSRYLKGVSCPEVSYRETNALNVVRDISDGHADVGVLRFQTQHAGYFENLLHENGLAAQPLWEYAMVVLLHESHPLAGLREIPYHLLGDCPQIVHGDLTPVLPPEADAPPTQHSGRRIAVYDRGSQFDFLRNVPGAYLWVSPVPFSVLAREGLLQKPCHSSTRYRDLVIHRAAEALREPELLLIQALRDEIAGLVQPEPER